MRSTLRISHPHSSTRSIGFGCSEANSTASSHAAANTQNTNPTRRPANHAAVETGTKYRMVNEVSLPVTKSSQPTAANNKAAAAITPRGDARK